MVDTVTTVLGLIKPEVGASTDTWGPKLNGNQDKVDILFTDPVKKMLKLVNGGTGADTAAGARTNFGLGTIALLNSIANANIDNDAITTAKILNGAVTAEKLASGLSFPAGTIMLFQQTNAPTGWTKLTTQDNKALRVVSGAAGSGGTVNFTTAFANRNVAGTTASTTAAGTVGDTALSIAQMPLHGHPFRLSVISSGSSAASTAITGGMPLRNVSESNYLSHTGVPSAAAGEQIGGSGAGATHTHTFTGTGHTHTYTSALDLAVQYVDVILAQKA